jgi:hypothetical protein
MVESSRGGVEGEWFGGFAHADLVISIVAIILAGVFYFLLQPSYFFQAILRLTPSGNGMRVAAAAEREWNGLPSCDIDRKPEG